MISVIFTVVVGYTIQAILVGVALAWFLASRNRDRLGPAGVGALVAFFGVLDLFWIPALLALDATITIGNEPVAELLGVHGSVPLDTLLSFGWTDLLIWIAESIVALITARLLRPRVRSAA